MHSGHNKILGAEGEALVCEYLADNGFSIIERNFYAGRAGELDIIAERGDLLLFVEVKTRSSAKFGGGIYSITLSKKRRMRAAATYFLVKYPKYNTAGYSIRFDLIIVKGNKIQCVEDIIR